MIGGQATSRTANELARRDVLENDKPSFHLKEKLFTPSEFTLNNEESQVNDDTWTFDSTGDYEIVAPSHNTDILANLLDGKRENLSTTFDSWIAKLLENGTEQKDTWRGKIKGSLSKQFQD